MKFFFALICILIGLNIGRVNIIISSIIAILFTIFMFYKYPKKTTIIYPLIILLSFIIQNIPIIYNQSDYLYKGIVVESKNNYFIFCSGLEKFYVYQKNNSYEVGDILVINSKPFIIEMTNYESRFDFKNYLFNKGITRSLYSNNTDIIFSSIFKFNAYKRKFLDNFDLETSFLIDSLLFANINYDSETLALAKSLNMISLMSVSGIYLSLLIRCFNKIFSRINSDKIKDILPYIVLLPYGAFTITKIGIQRVFISGFIKYINKYLLKNKFDYLTLTSFIGILFIVFDYHNAYQSGFLISFGLIYMLYFARMMLKRFSNKKRKIMTFIIIQIFLFPIICFDDGSFYLLNPLLNNILLPFNQLTFLASYLSFLTTVPFKNVLWFLCKANYKALELISLLHINIVMSDIFSHFFKASLYITSFSILYFLEVKRIKTSFLTSVPLITIFILSLMPVYHLTNAIYFVNVGQGDCIVVRNNDKAIMIDTGGNVSFDIASESLIPFLRKKQIYKLDALIVSHNDKDHSGGVSSLLANYQVNKLLTNRDDFPYKVGDIYLENINNYNYSDENDKSLVFNLSFMNKKWLLMGDASKNVENYLLQNNIDIKCDVIKIGHHGSKTSTGESFIQKCSPKEAIISVGEKNSYNHPNYEVIKILEKYKINIRRTDKEGTISYVSI